MLNSLKVLKFINLTEIWANGYAHSEKRAAQWVQTTFDKHERLQKLLKFDLKESVSIFNLFI